MKGIRKARASFWVAASALLFTTAFAEDEPSPTPIPTPTPSPICTPAGRATNGCWEVPNDPHAAMQIPDWTDVDYSTNEVAELVLIRQDLVALRRFVVVIGGMLFAWFVMSFLFDAITGRR